MLTKQQLKKLTPLTKDTKYGKALKFAIAGWKKCRPVRQQFGVVHKNGFWRRSKEIKFNKTKSTGCCLCGAALLNRKVEIITIPSEFVTQTIDLLNLSQIDYIDLDIMYLCLEFEKKFKLDRDDFFDLSDGWENINQYKDSNAYKFGQKIREILNPC